MMLWRAYSVLYQSCIKVDKPLRHFVAYFGESLGDSPSLCRSICSMSRLTLDFVV